VRELNERENQNILKFKLDKMIELKFFPVRNIRKIVLSGALNSFSSRSVSFIFLVKRKGFINPFFKLLDFSDRNAKMS
jgi:hypothetical protein